MFKVYWTNPYTDESFGESFDVMIDAIKACETYRQSGKTFVTMVQENPNQVGKMGVDSIINGKTPDGENYDWKKRRL